MSEKPPFVNVYIESNPNPNSLKFVLNFNIVENLQLDYPDPQGASGCPLAVALFEQFGFVQRVFISSNFVTITKDEPTDWMEVQMEVRAFVKKWFEDGKPVFSADLKQEVKDKEENPVLPENELEAKIVTVLDEYVRPAVESDGGAITFQSFNDGVVTVMLQGSCSGCPSSTVTLKSGIENLLTRMVPEVKEVVAQEG